jgi:hypothetical protein
VVADAKCNRKYKGGGHQDNCSLRPG